MDSRKSEISVLAKDKKYDEIIAHPDATKEQKAISLIKMERFKEALKHCDNNTFEKSYCFYKIGKYKAALKTAGTKRGDAWCTLRSQIYYKLDRHQESIDEIKKLKTREKKGPVLVNYAASVALAVAENRTEESKPKPAEVEEILRNIKDEKVDIQGEVLYNLSFAYLSDRQVMLSKLKEIDTPDRDHRELVNAQIYNIQDKQKEISPSVLTKSNKAIHRYNTEAIQTPCLLETMKKFQIETYYQNKIKQFSRTQDVPEICNIIDDLRENNAKSAVKLVSKLSRKNSLRFKKMLENENILTKGLNRIILKKK